VMPESATQNRPRKPTINFWIAGRRRHPDCPLPPGDFGTIPRAAPTSRYQFAPAFEMSVMAGHGPFPPWPAIVKAFLTESGGTALRAPPPTQQRRGLEKRT
jgi:hypothetical protein